jgi:hypothetical protein
MPMQGARMPYLDLTDEWIPELRALFAIITELNKFTPSAVSLREQRAREQADRTIEAFSERFTETGFFPDDNEWPVFALLPQLAEWPADLSLRLVDEQNELIARWIKGADDRVIKRSVILVQKNNGDYAAPGENAQPVDASETFFQLILRLLPTDARLGVGDNFPGSTTTAGRIVTLREQIAALVRSEQAQLFDALLADDAEIKSGSDDRLPNPFLPFWQQPPADRSPALNMLLALNPEISAARFEALLEHVPLSDAQSDAFVKEGELPEPFIEALEQSIAEWSKDKGLDGIFHSRTYSPDADVLAQEFGAALLKERFGLELIITESWHAAYEPSGPDDTAIVLKHDGNGRYGLRDLHDGEVNWFRGGTDSFYRAIGSALQPHQRLSLGMQSETDVAGLRTTLGKLAAEANGGWFDTQSPIQVKNDLLPEWLKNASMADKRLWNQAWEDYRQALLEAQTSDFPGIEQYGSPEYLRNYARKELEQRLRSDLGVTISADEITVETSKAIPNPVLLPNRPSGTFVYTRRSLTEVSVNNLGIDDINFWATARFLDPSGKPIAALGKRYVFELVRELNVGDSYGQFLRQKLLTSSFSQWSRERYAQVMASQMRLDAVEAKMAGDFPDRANRSYQWVQTVLDHPVDDDSRRLVEEHRIQVQTLKLNYVPRQDRPQFAVGEVLIGGVPVEGLGQRGGVVLGGLLMIAPESRGSVPGRVVYTPTSPEGINFRQFSSHEEMEGQLLDNAELWDYLASRVPVKFRSELREVLSDTNDRKFLSIKAQPAVTTDFYVHCYEAEVEQVIAQVDDQTTSTSEANWNTAWNIASTLGELALEFAPFKVALPIAAARSLYALTQGVRAIGQGDASASLHFIQAVLLLTDGLPGGKKPKIKLSPNIEPKWALKTTPADLKLRTDGRFKGVYEKVDADGQSSFYAQDAGHTFAIRYDSSDGVWRVINGRNPRSFYQMPVRFNGQGRWGHAPAVRGGVPGKGEKKAMKAKKAAEAAEARGEPEPSTATKGVPSANKRLTLNMDGFFEGKEFKRAEKDITQGDLKKAVNRAVDRYVLEGSGSLHPSKGGLFTLDLLGLGGGKRGKWRLAFEPPKGGVLKVHSIMDPH